MTHDEDNPLRADPSQPADPVPQSGHLAAPAAEVVSASEARPLPDDIRVPWDWVDVLLFVLIGVGGTSLLGILAVIGLGLIGVTPAHLQKISPAHGA